MSERGYSLVELMMSAGIMLAVLASVFSLAAPAHSTAYMQAEMQDMQQRARVLADRLTHDLWLAGAGPTAVTRRGPLSVYFAPVMPSICCGSAADTPGSVYPDRLTIAYVPRGSPEALTAAAVTPVARRLDLSAGTSCSSAVPVCGFADGDLLVLFDDSGRRDMFKLDLASGIPMLDPLDASFDATYDAGATVSRIVVHTYYRDPGSNQVFAGEGDSPPQPFIDHVVALRFGYSDAAGTPLEGLLSDGPWRGSARAMYDSDLLRIRRVRVSWTIRSGMAATGALRIPDMMSTFEVALRNAPDRP